MVETLFVLALAAFYFSGFPVGVGGAVETVEGGVLKGWVEGGARRPGPVEVQLYIDGRFAASAYAGVGEAVAGRGGDSRLGFSFALAGEVGTEHEARVYAVVEAHGGRRVLSLLGRPVRFSTGTAG